MHPLSSWRVSVTHAGSVSQADVDDVEDAVEAAQEHFDIEVHACDPGRVQVRLIDRSHPLFAAFTRPVEPPARYSIVVFAGGPYWSRSSLADRRFVILHEWYHVVQFSLLCDRGSCFRFDEVVPEWLLEGSAEYMAARASDDLRFGSYSVDRRFEILAASRIFAPLRSLRTIRHPSAATYGLAFAAAELLAKRSGDDAITKFFDEAGRTSDIEGAFEEAFGMSIERFYKAFERHRAAGFPR